MKVTDKTNEKKRKIKKKPIDKSKKQQVLVVAQEIKFARLLSGNEKKTRDRVLKALKKWLVNCFEKNYEFKEDDFTRVWKGLFYAVWMSDKPIVQEDLCESIAGILDLFPVDRLPAAMMLTKAGFKMLATEWFGIDQHRIDKFLMLVRRFLRGALRCVQRCGWREAACEQFAGMLSNKDGILALNTPLYARNATSMVIHIADCYLEEISKVSSGEVPPDSLCILLGPFLAYLARGASAPICIASRRMINELLRHGDPEDQDSEAVSDTEEYGEGGDSDRVEQNGGAHSDEELQAGPLDPRAGRVDVILSSLPVPAEQLVARLKQLLPQAKGAGHRRARRCIQLLEQFSSGSHPYAPPAPPLDLGPRLKPTKTAKALRALEKKLVANGDELALRGLSRKHRKRLLAKSRAGLSIVDDLPNHNHNHNQRKHKRNNNTNNGGWQVEDTENVATAKATRKRANKENETETKKKKQKLNTEPTADNEANKLINNVKKQKNKVNNDVNRVKDFKDVKKDIKSKVKVNSVKELKNTVKDLKNVVKQSVKHNKSQVNVNSIKEVKNTVKEIKNNVKVKSVNVENGVAKESVKNNAKLSKKEINKKDSKFDREAKLLVKKVKKFQKQDNSLNSTPKKVKFVLKNNSIQGTMDYYKSLKESPNIPFDSSKRPSKTNLKPSTPSPINPFFKKKMTRRASFAAQIVY